jgi:hypothetical protein
MADQGIKKVIIPRSSLPPAGKNGEYLVRYRIVSEDKNRYSHWSPVHKVFGKAIDKTNIQGRIEQTGSIILVAWDSVKDISSYDIFVKYNTDADYSYHGSSISNNYSIIKGTGQSISIKVQIGGIFKEIVDGNNIYTGTLSLV